MRVDLELDHKPISRNPARPVEYSTFDSNEGGMKRGIISGWEKRKHNFVLYRESRE